MGGLHGAGGLAEHVRGVGHRQVGDVAQQHDRALIGTEPRECFDGGRRADAVEDLFVTVVEPRLGFVVEAYVATAPRLAPPFVDEPVMGDGEHPTPHRRGVALVRRETADHGDENVAEQIFGLGRSRAAQIPENRGRKIPIDRLETITRFPPRRAHGHGHGTDRTTFVGFHKRKLAAGSTVSFCPAGTMTPTTASGGLTKPRPRRGVT